MRNPTGPGLVAWAVVAGVVALASVRAEALEPLAGVGSISAGQFTTCAVVAGGIQCWGEAPLGDGTNAISHVPVQAKPAGSGATKVSVGSNHVCAVVSGRIECWGAGTATGLTGSNLVPTVVPTGGIEATDVAAGGGHTCAVIDGGVKCWGSNNRGQLGVAPINAGGTTPLEVFPAGSGATAVHAGPTFSCAIVNGGVKCWGLQGLLGDGSTSPDKPFPVDVVGIASGATSLGGGISHACAVVNGGVKCWGSDGTGALGNGSLETGPRYTPVDVCASIVCDAPLAGVTAISASPHAGSTCAAANGGVKCWGSSSQFQLGDGVSRNEFPAPVDVAALGPGSGATGVAAGQQHACAVVDGSMRCWGDNGDSQLANGSLGNYHRYPQIALDDGSGATAVATGTGSDGFGATCAVVAGSAYCWGSDNEGLLGDGLNNIPRGTHEPRFVADSVTAISVGGDHACAIIAGAVRCWGDQSGGKLGNGSASSSSVHAPSGTPAIASGATAIAAGEFHSCAVANGEVWCWGSNTGGRLGIGTTSGQSTVAVLTPGAGPGAMAVVIGDAHSCAVADGGVKCWGANGNGQLGVGEGDTTLRSSPAPVAGLGVGAGVTAIAAGGNGTCAVVDGGVRCWGYGTGGALGNGGTSNHGAPVVTLPTGSGATAIAVGAGFGCAIVNGGVKCWGQGDWGHIGDGALDDRLSPVDVLPAGSNATAIAAAEDRACAVVASGVRCWGYGPNGEIGDEATGFAPYALPVMTRGVSSVTVATSPVAPAPSTPITFTATVSPTASDGTVTFRRDGISMGNGNVVNGTATYLRTAGLAGGLYHITATFNGSLDAFPATSSELVLQVGAPTITIAPPSFSSVVVGTTLSSGFTATGGAGPHTFSVSSGSLPPGLSLTGSSGLLSGTTSLAGAYAFTIRATDNVGFTGERAYVFTVLKQATGTTLATSNASVEAGQSVTFTATVTGGTPGGNVAFRDGGTPIPGCDARPLDSGVATCMTNMLAVGSHDITAAYTGDTNHAPSTSAVVVQTVTTVRTVPFMTAIVFPFQSTFGQPVAFTAQVGGVGATGTVRFRAAGATIAGCEAVALVVGSPFSEAVCTTAALAVGTHPMLLEYSGDANYLPTSVAGFSYVVSPAPAPTTTLLQSSPNPSNAGAPVTFTATVNGQSPTGVVDFVVGGAPVGGCAGVPLSGAQAICVTSTIPVGSHTVVAQYVGDANNDRSTSAAVVHVVNAVVIPSGVTLVASPNPAAVGETITLTATVTGNAPTGAVTFHGATEHVPGCLSVALVAGTATCTTSYAGAGTYVLRAIYPGDANNAFSISPPIGVQVGAERALVGHWEGEWSPDDSSPGANHGSTHPSFVPGARGGFAFQFDGASRVAMNGTGTYQFGSGEFSVAYWVRFDSLVNNGTGMVHKDSHPDDTRGWLFNVCDDCGGLGMQVRDQAAGIDDHVRVPTAFFTPGRWYHIAGVRRGTELRLYVDGVPMAVKTTASIADVSNDEALAIGSLSLDTPQYLHGAVDDVRLYNYALVNDEVASMVDVRPAGRFVMGNHGTSTVALVDTASRTILGAPAFAFPGEIVRHPDGDRLYIVDLNGSLVAYSSGSNEFLFVDIAVPSPGGLAINATGTRAYVPNQMTPELSVIDLAQQAVVESIPVPGAINLTHVAVHPDGSRVYVGDQQSTVYVVDTVAGAVVAQVGVGDFVAKLAVHPAGTYLYAANINSSDVSVIDIATHAVVATVPVGPCHGAGPVSVAVHPSGEFLYAPACGFVHVIRTSDHTVVGRVAVGNFPIHVAFDPAGELAYVSNYQDGTVSVVSTRMHAVVDTIAVGGYAGSGAATRIAGFDAAVSTSPNPSSPGQAVQVTASIGGSQGTAAFLDGASTVAGCEAVPLVDSLATCTTDTLTLGTHAIRVVYSGAGMGYGFATSPVTHAVVAGPPATSTSLTSLPNPSTFRSNARFTATVTGTGATGTVAFRTGAQILCEGRPLAGGVATCDFESLAPGIYAVVATYSGDAAHAGSISPPLTHTVDRMPSTTSLAASPNPSTAGGTVTFTATVTGASPSGPVSFKEEGTALPGCGAQPVVSDVATCSTSSLAAGVHSIVAEFAGDTYHLPSVSAPLSQTVTSGTPTLVASGGTPQSALTSTAYGALLRATALDALGHPVAGVSVTFTLPATGASGSFPGPVKTVSIPTDESGVAIAPTLTASGTAGNFTTMASAPGFPSVAFQLTNVARSGSAIVPTSGGSQSAVVATAYADRLVATVTTNGQPMPNVAVTFTLPGGSGASGTFATGGTTRVEFTNAAGVATSPEITANMKKGAFNATAKVAGVSGSAVFPLTNLAGAPATITARVGAQTVNVYADVPRAFAVLVKDAYGNTVVGRAVTFTAPSSGPSGTFADGGGTSDDAPTETTGIATASSYKANGIVGVYAVTASIDALSATFAMTHRAGTTSTLTVVDGSPQSAVAGTPFAAPLKVVVRAENGMAVQNAQVTFTLPTGTLSATFDGASPSSFVTTTLADGTATAPAMTAKTKAGTFNARIVVAGISGSTSLPLTVLAGAPVTIQANGVGAQSATVNVQFAKQPSVKVLDAWGNVVPDVPVVFSVPTTGPSGTFAGGPAYPVSTGTNGIATMPAILANSTIGVWYVTVTSPLAPLTFKMTNVIGAGATIRTHLGTPQWTPRGELFPLPLSAIVRDAQSNPVAGVVVTFTLPSSAGTARFQPGNLRTLTATTGTDGIATTAMPPTAGSTLSAVPYLVNATASGTTGPAQFELSNQ